MSRRDESDSSLKEVLQRYEEAEAAVLRRELVAFLSSAECREVLERTVQKPIETIVQSALANQKFQEQIRDAVIRALQPELVKAAETAAANALKDVKVTIPEETQVRMRKQAEEATGHALGPESAAPRPARTSLRNRLLAAAAGVAVIAAGLTVYYFTRRSGDGPAGLVGEQVGTVSNAATVSDSAPPEPEPQPSPLLQAYRVALSRAGSPALPQPAAAELQCVANAVEQVERGGTFDVAALRGALNRCAATRDKPARSSRIIAAVQAQLSEESRKQTCSDLRPVTIDGLHGGETSRALGTYVRCTAPAGVPEKLDTLGDYAAVGVYFIHKRMRDGNDLQ